MEVIVMLWRSKFENYLGMAVKAKQPFGFLKGNKYKMDMPYFYFFVTFLFIFFYQGRRFLKFSHFI